MKSLPDPLAGLPNGLGTPLVIDVDLNGTGDFAYAGDMFGNLYRFDISDSNQSNWSFTKLFQASYDGTAATRQPITVRPHVLKHPTESGYIIIFGTGSYMTEYDGVSTDIQSVYGIWERFEVAPPTATMSAKFDRLVEQVVTNVFDESNANFARQRIVSANAVNYIPDAGLVEGTYGWFIDLDMQRPSNTISGNPNPDLSGEAPPLPQYPGERAVRRIVPRGGAALITTVIPRDANTCFRSPPGSTFPIDLVTGGNPTSPVIDVNNDGVLDGNDMVDVGGEMYAAGILFDTDDLDGTLVDPSVLIGSGDSDFLFLSGGDDQLTLRVKGADSPKTGRLSWRELDVQL